MPDAGALARQWRGALDQAQHLVPFLSAERVGTAVLTRDGQLFTGGEDDLRSALAGDTIRFHDEQSAEPCPDWWSDAIVVMLNGVEGLRRLHWNELVKKRVTRKARLAAVRADSERALDEMIRRWQALPPVRRTHFLRKRVGICRTAL